MRFRSKRWLHAVGGVLALMSVMFVIERLYRHSAQIDISRFDGADWLSIMTLASIYGAANTLLAFAWRRLLFFFESEVDRKWAVRTYGLSQLAKYVPGNVFQFAGRQALGMAAGLAATPLVKSTLWELGLIAVAGTVIGLLALPLLWPDIPGVVSYIGFGMAVIGVGFVLGRSFSVDLSFAWWYQIAFLTLSGLVFVAILILIVPSETTLPHLAAVYGAYVLAWLLGLVTPGAPAGVGIRETVLLFMLGNAVVPGDLILAILLGRAVTVAGDLLFFLASLGMVARSPGGGGASTRN